MKQLVGGSDATQDWDRVRPLLDEGMASLSDGDRNALLLRYFKNQDLRSIGAALAVSEDAAQKRVTRAVERLRRFLDKRGVAIGSSGLVLAVTAHAVQAAPTALITSISTTAVLAGTGIAATTTLIESITMTTVQKLLFGGTLLVAIATGIHEARQASRLRQENASLLSTQVSLSANLQRLERNLGDATNHLVGRDAEFANPGNVRLELLALRGEVTRLRRENQELARPATKTETGGRDEAEASLLDRVKRLKLRLNETPEARIPELRFLTEQDWLTAATPRLDTEDDYRRALAHLCSVGEHHFLLAASRALEKYLDQHNEAPPTEVSQLTPYFDTPPDDLLLSRYKIEPQQADQTTGSPDRTGTGAAADWVITLKSPDFGSIQKLGLDGGAEVTSLEDAGDMAILAPALKAMSDATPSINGSKSMNIRSLPHYIATPEQQAAIERLLGRNAARK